MIKKPLKVCLFHTEFFYSGGAEKLIFHQIDYLEKKGFKITCFAAFVDWEKCYPQILKKYAVRQILPEFLNKIVTHDLMILLTTLTFPLVVFKFKNFDVYFGENQTGPWWAAMAAKIFKKPYITYQNYPTTFTHPRKIDRKQKRNTFLVNILIDLFKPILVKIDRLVVKKANVVVANGEYAKLICDKTYERKFVNCPAGCEKLTFNKKIFENRFLGKLEFSRFKITKPYILVTNRHVLAKRIDLGIKAVAQLKTNLVITGDFTDYTHKLKPMIKKLNLSDKIQFTGLIADSELRTLYQNAAVYIYCAPEEDFGLGIIEAMGAGVPVVAWDNAGPAYLVERGITGLLAKPFDLNDFAVKVNKLLKDRPLNFKISKTCYLVSKQFSWDNHGKILEASLRQILN